MSVFHVLLLGAVFKGEDGTGERADVAWAAAGPVEDLPGLQDREAAFGVGADSGMAAVGLPVGVRQVSPLVRGKQSDSCTTHIAFVGVEVKLGAGGDGEHAVGAGGGQVVGEPGQGPGKVASSKIERSPRSVCMPARGAATPVQLPPAPAYRANLAALGPLADDFVGALCSLREEGGYDCAVQRPASR